MVGARQLGEELGGVLLPDVAEIRIEHRASKPALVAEDEPAAVFELNREPIPARGVLGVDEDPAGHAQVQTERGTIIGLQPHELAAPVRGGERVADQRGGDLSRLVGPGHVGVAVIDGDDPPAEDGLERPARSLDFGQLRHVRPA